MSLVIPAKAGIHLLVVIPAKAGIHLLVVIPAKAGIHLLPTSFALSSHSKINNMDSRFRGNDNSLPSRLYFPPASACVRRYRNS